MTTNEYEEEQEVGFTWTCEIGSPGDPDFDLVMGDGDGWFDPDTSPRELIDTLKQQDQKRLQKKGGTLVLESLSAQGEDYLEFITVRNGMELATEKELA